MMKSFVDVMDKLGTKYVEIQGDGGYALFDGDNSLVRAFLACETYRTVFINKLAKDIKRKYALDIKIRSGLASGDVIVKRVGKRDDAKLEKNHEVWIEKVVNLSSKLTKEASPNELAVTEQEYHELSRYDEIKLSCGHSGGSYTGNRSLLWKKLDLNNLVDIGVKEVWILASTWCEKCGPGFFQKIAKKASLDL